MSKKYYTIRVGQSEGQLVEVGEVNKDTGLPKGPTTLMVAPPGGTSVPNFSRIWGKRKMTKENKPTGEFEPMPWGDPDGEVIPIRYLKSCKSLDIMYQDLVNLKPGMEEMEIDLPHGITDFDEGMVPLLVQMLKLHSLNGDNKYKNPEIQTVIFTEYDDKSMTKKRIQKGETLYEAMGLVMKAKADETQLRVLAAICGIDGRQQNNVIVDKLLEIVEKTPDTFLAQRNYYRDQVRRVLLRCVDFGLLDFAPSAKVNLLADNGGTVLSAIPTSIKGDKKIDYMVDNAFDPAVYDAMEKIKDALNKKELELA